MISHERLRIRLVKTIFFSSLPLIAILLLLSSGLAQSSSAIEYSTYLGGNDFELADGIDLILDDSGNIYITGGTRSEDFPQFNANQPLFSGGFSDAIVVKVNPAGNLIYSTYLGGSGDDRGYGITADADGNAYVTGFTCSDNFPTTQGAFDRTFNGTPGFSYTGECDAFLTKFDPNGVLLYSSYLGGSLDDGAGAIELDGSGDIFILGETTSLDFPVSASSFQSALAGDRDAFVLKMKSSGQTLEYATYLGGSGSDTGGTIGGADLEINEEGSAYIVGSTDSADFPMKNAINSNLQGGLDAYISVLDPTGSILSFSTFLGGTALDLGSGIAIDESGMIYITGSARSDDFPITAIAFDSTFAVADAFVAKIDPITSQLIYATYLGGSAFDNVFDIALLTTNSVYVTGLSLSDDFPINNAVQPMLAGDRDVIVSNLDLFSSSLPISTFLGGSGADLGHKIVVDDQGHIYVSGTTSSTDFPVTSGSIQQTYGGGIGDFFLIKIIP